MGLDQLVRMMKPMKKIILSIILFPALLLVGLAAHSQFSSYPNLDSNTRNALEQIERLIRTGNIGQAEIQVQEIISNAGYVKALAQLYYRMAQNEEQFQKVAQHYTAMIENWPQSAWAQKAAIEMIPLLIMSNGQMGTRPESVIWQHSLELLSLSSDASTIGESDEMLLADVHHQLLKLAANRYDQNLIRRIAEREPSQSPHHNHNQLIVINTYIQSEEWDEARRRLEDWLKANPRSELRPHALSLYYQCAQDPQERNRIMGQLQSQFPSSLELKQLQ